MDSNKEGKMPPDEELLEWYLKPVRLGFYNPEEWGQITGVIGGRRIRQILDGNWDRLNAETRRKIYRLATRDVEDLDLEYRPPDPGWGSAD